MNDLELYDEDDDDRPEQSAEEIQAEIDAALAELAEAAAGANMLLEQAPGTGPAEATGTALVPAGKPATEHRAALARTRSSLIHQQQRMAELRAVVKAKRDELERRLDAQLAELNAVLEPMRKQVALMEEGIWTINLYLGRDEHIEPLRGGEPAPATEPIHIRQAVLSMSEESLVAVEDGGMDAKSIEEFDAWILADPAHLEQVLPEQKGLVCLVPTWGKHYEDPWQATAMQEANERTYWLFRNGERLYRLTTDLQVGRHLMPLRDEFTSFFEREVGYGETRQKVAIEPGSSEWLKAEEAANERQRHFMRVALVVQGVLDRTTLFQPLPAPVSVLEPESYDAGHVVIIADADAQLTTGRPAFYTWLRSLQDQVVAGMRVIGKFDMATVGPERDRGQSYGGRLTPREAYPPADDEIYVVDQRRNHTDRFHSGDRHEFVFKFKRLDTRYGWEHGDHGHWGEWPYKKRASCVIRPGDRFWLPLDLVTIEEMRAYMEARSERHAYLDMIPLLQRAVSIKQAERDAEAPMRDLLAGELAKAHSIDLETAAEAVIELVDWWKLNNKWHRPLVPQYAEDDPGLEARAIKGIIAEYGRRARQAGQSALEEAMVDQLADGHGDDLLFVGRKASGEFVAIVAEHFELGEVVAGEGRFVKGVKQTPYVRRLTIGVRAGIKRDERWMIAGQQWRRLRALYVGERWEKWEHGASPDRWLTGPEAEQMAARLVERETHSPWVGWKPGWRSDDKPVEYRPVAITFYDAGQRFTLHLTKVLAIPEDQKVLPARPLTARRPTPKGYTVEWSWKRDADGVAQLEEPDKLEDHPHEIKTWRLVGSHGRADEVTRIIWIDWDADAMVDDTLAWNAYVGRYVTALRGQVNSAIGAVEKQWLGVLDALAYERFMEDYQDATLWPAHKAKLPKVEFPYDKERRGDRPSNLRRLFTALVDRGHGLTGHSVAELLDRYRVLVPQQDPCRLCLECGWGEHQHYQKLKSGGRQVTSNEDCAGWGTALDIPDDILAFKIPVDLTHPGDRW